MHEAVEVIIVPDESAALPVEADSSATEGQELPCPLCRPEQPCCTSKCCCCRALSHHINRHTSQCLGTDQQLAAAASCANLGNTHYLLQLPGQTVATPSLTPNLLLLAKHVHVVCCAHCFNISKFLLPAYTLWSVHTK